MRRLLPVVALAGAATLIVGIGWAYAARATRLHGEVTLVLTAGTLVALASVVGMVIVERRADGLRVPAAARLPAPDTTWPVLAVGLCDVVGGAFASRPILAVGVALVGLSGILAGARMHRVTDTTSEQPAGPIVDDAADRAAVVAARRILAFGRRHRAGADGGLDGGLDVDVEIQHVGRDLVRLVLVAPDGTLGDVVVKSEGRGRTAAALAGVRVHDQLPGDVSARIRSSDYEWRRMAGRQLRGR